MLNKKKIIAGIVILIATIWLGIRFILGGPEDNWVCQEGQWKKHGQPALPQPTGACTMDGIFAGKESLDDGQTTMIYQPMQCDPKPWMIWFQALNEGKEIPKDEELIPEYYKQAHAIQVSGVKNVSTDKIVCEACSICPTTNYYQLTATTKDVDFLNSEGWQKK